MITYWDSILGQRFNPIITPEAPKFAKPSYDRKESIKGWKAVQHYNQKKRMTFTRSIGYK